jgi:hypothetical protein
MRQYFSIENLIGQPSFRVCKNSGKRVDDDFMRVESFEQFSGHQGVVQGWD